MRILIFCFIVLLSLSCKFNGDKEGSNNDYQFNSENVDVEYIYEDGTYCAEIEYYYHKTGTRSTYTLEVEIIDNELTKIYWSNGGWLDDSHFDPPEIEDGHAEFISDRGIEYFIEITEEGGCYSSSNYSPEDLVCPRCGDDKYEHEEYCESCIDEFENTCSRCGSFEYDLLGGLCTICKEDESKDEW
tara:strand:+ start:3376 stop:3936 length:561 start_codon:yes stop_codon:yes gene_type:complete